MAAIKLERVFEIIQTFARYLVPRIRKPAIRLYKNGRTKEAVTIPPVTGA
jgi:hypothetical protein